MTVFLNQNDREQIIKSLSLKIKKENILNSLDVWEKIWKDYNIKYNFFMMLQKAV